MEIDFGREVCGDLNSAETREWLVTNGTGSYASGSDASLRPNQLLAVSLPESPLTFAQQRGVVDACGRTLVTSFGLRSVVPGETQIIRMRLSEAGNPAAPFDGEFGTIFQNRQREADEFYQAVCPHPLTGEMRSIQRQAFAGMLWGKQFYSMPDKWEYPWFAAWDLAFHTIPLALIDPDYAKRQLYLLIREW